MQSSAIVPMPVAASSGVVRPLPRLSSRMTRYFAASASTTGTQYALSAASPATSSSGLPAPRIS